MAQCDSHSRGKDEEFSSEGKRQKPCHSGAYILVPGDLFVFSRWLTSCHSHQAFLSKVDCHIAGSPSELRSLRTGRAHSHPQPRALPIGGRRRAELGAPKTNNRRPETLRPRSRTASAWCAPAVEPRPPWPPRSPPFAVGTQAPPSGAAAGLYWAGQKVEKIRSHGRPAPRCCSRGPGQRGRCRRHGLRDSAPRAFKAEGAGPSRRVARTAASVVSGPPGRLARTCDLQGGALPGLLDGEQMRTLVASSKKSRARRALGHQRG